MFLSMNERAEERMTASWDKKKMSSVDVMKCKLFQSLQGAASKSFRSNIYVRIFSQRYWKQKQKRELFHS